MLIRRDDGFEIDTDSSRLDVALVHEWISTDSYWARGRAADVMSRAIDGSLCFGVYHPGGAQVGFGRMVTDGATFAWLCDVYVSPTARGQGLGTWLARTARDLVQQLGVQRIVLATADAHDVYARAGFLPFASPDRWMEIDNRTSAAATGDVTHT